MFDEEQRINFVMQADRLEDAFGMDEKDAKLQEQIKAAQSKGEAQRQLAGVQVLIARDQPTPSTLRASPCPSTRCAKSCSRQLPIRKCSSWCVFFPALPPFHLLISLHT